MLVETYYFFLKAFLFCLRKIIESGNLFVYY